MTLGSTVFLLEIQKSCFQYEKKSEVNFHSVSGTILVNETIWFSATELALLYLREKNQIVKPFLSNQKLNKFYKGKAYFGILMQLLRL